LDADFWRARWAENRIGFHEGRPNDFLVEHVELLGGPQRVLVPLCGKAEDLAFLASRGHEVVGVELARDAAEAFFREHDLVPLVDEGDAFTSFRVDTITIFVGDFFDATPEMVDRPTAFYDRAALVALPEQTRGRYVAHLRSLCAPNAHGILVTFDYPQDRMEGPPFAVTETEARQLFTPARIERLGGRTVEGGRVASAGLRAIELCFQVALEAGTPVR
jgi:thiopurine S-methyltransferase